MRKYIKMGPLVFVVLLSLILGSSLVYAVEDTSTTSEVENKGGEIRNNIKEIRQQGKEDFQKIREENKNAREDIQLKRDEFKNGIKQEKENFKANKEEKKTELESLIGDIKAKREEFKKEMEANKEALKLKIETAREEWKTNLAKIKDEKKKVILDNIVTNLTDLNAKLTEQLGVKVDQIESVLVSIQSRITKAEAKGIDVTTTKAKVTLAEKAIEDARTAISEQSKIVYTSSLTDETKLKAEMQTLRDKFKTDIKAVYEKVKLAHVAVKDTATTLAQTPKINETEVEETASGTSEVTN